jgi:hypothetical protein
MRRAREVVVIGERLHDNTGEVIGTPGFCIDVTPTSEPREDSITEAGRGNRGESSRY